jgi:cytochrome c biogenesis protein CcdA
MGYRIYKNSIHHYIILIIIVLLIATIGYSSFVLYPQLFLSVSAGSGLFLLAIMAGMASLFSPCSFPLLVTLLAREATTRSRLSLVRSATAFTMGTMLFLGLVGLILALGAGSSISQFTFTSPTGRVLRVIVGSILIRFGFWQVQGKSLNFAWVNRSLQPLWNQQVWLRRRNNNLSYGLYGFGYILAGFG